MSIYFKYIFLFLILALSFYGQTIKLNCAYNGFLFKEHVMKEGKMKIDETLDRGKYIVATQPGFMSQVLEANSLFGRGIENFDFNLKDVRKPILAASQKKIKFIKFADPGNKIGHHMQSFTAAYATVKSNVTIDDPRLAREINKFLETNGFNAVSDVSSVFNEKSKEADLAIAADVLGYYIDSKKEGDGYRASVILNLSVYDAEKQDVVFTFLAGGYSNESTKIDLDEVFILACKDAMYEFINHPDFIKLVDKVSFDEESLKALTFEKFSIPALSPPVLNENKNYIQNSIKSVVTVKTAIGGHGSGFVISNSGYLLTNAHVVIDDSTNLEVIFSNGVSLPAELIRINPKIDIALLKIPGNGYAPLSLDTTSVNDKIGGDVVAIGTPKDIKLGQTVTKGIISGLREFEDKIYIQTDVSINPGNSGGPLITKNGQVVGIVTWKRKDSEGLGFALPINEGLKALNIQLKN